MPTTGASGYEQASAPISGTSGSWTWTTSGAKARSSRRIFVTPSGKTEMLDTAPLAPNAFVRASGIMYSGTARGSARAR